MSDPVSYGIKSVSSSSFSILTRTRPFAFVVDLFFCNYEYISTFLVEFVDIVIFTVENTYNWVGTIHFNFGHSIFEVLALSFIGE